jgi:o-succinylbenzoate---CoA ligase
MAVSVSIGRLTINALNDWLTLRARTHAGAPALIVERKALDYATLDAGASRVARRLAARGVRAGDRVATTLPAGVEFAELLHALPRLGAVLVPVNTRLSAGERRWLLEDAGARLVVEDCLEGPEADIGLRTHFEPDAVQTILYTSGTTARPKPVALTYRNNAASAFASAWNLGVAPDDRWLCVLPVFHVGGLQILIRSAVYGTAAVLHERFDPAAVASSLTSGEATLVSLVATMLARLRDIGVGQVPALRAALIGGGPVPRPLLEWAHEAGIPVVQTYGMTETASQVATLGVADALGKVGSAGKPLPGVDVRIGDDGEIAVRGPMVPAGALAPDGWLHTGDRGRLEDGYLYVEGRIKDTIVTGGENVAAPEVEEALLAHPSVRDAAVVGRPDAEWGEVVAAYIVGNAVSDNELREHCRSRLAPYKVPKCIKRVDEIPRTASGKILKGRLGG